MTLEDDRVITPDEVLGPPRPGRKVVLSGDTAPAATVLEAARGAEVLVHEATFLDEERERAQETATRPRSRRRRSPATPRWACWP